MNKNSVILNTDLYLLCIFLSICIYLYMVSLHCSTLYFPSFRCSFVAGLKEIAIVRLTHTQCPSVRAGNSSDDPPVCFRNNLPLRLRHRAVALIQMNHFTNLLPPLTRRQSFLSFPPVLFSLSFFSGRDCVSCV